MAQEAETMDLAVAVRVVPLAVAVRVVPLAVAVRVETLEVEAVDTPTLAEATAAKAVPMLILAIQVLRTEAVTS